MKRFSFRLDRVLDLKTSTERERARELGHAVRSEADRRYAIESSRRRLHEAHRKAAEVHPPVRQAGLTSSVALAVEAARRVAEADVKALAAAIEHRKTVLQRFEEARQARRALERVRDKRQATWRQEAGRFEQSELDEAALHRVRQARRTG